MSAACRVLGAWVDVSRLNATAKSIAFSNPSRTELVKALLGQGDLLWEFLGDLLGLTSSYREDITWSGGNLVRASFFTCFAKEHIKA
ncbi:hypothetical protein Taro_008138 [Colocasia esculenta]|uniref:Uncharacterized protein n=1 Tax=Colocasia esculenta TaxID=4460 RepID=A0A843TXE0_COLES|nr:hypothetical protein [Colocasia esculenta]